MKYRNIIEMTAMTNNEEIIAYTDKQLTYDSDLSSIIKAGYFNKPRLKISRPIYEVELADGLDILLTPIKSENEDVPKITLFIDELHWLVDKVQLHKQVSEEMDDEKTKKIWADPSHLLSEIVAYQYYDCMSGGISRYLIALIRYIMNNYRINWNEYVYPTPKDSEKEHYTLRDFYQSTECCSIDMNVHTFMKRLPKGLLKLESGD